MHRSKAEICVIGAGVVGLSTALNIQQTIPSTNVTVIADKFLSETLSYGAGGFFRPEVNIGRSRQSIKEWASDSYKHFSILAETEPQSGNTVVPGYQISAYSVDSLKNELVESIVSSGVEKMTDEELRTLFPERYKYGIMWTSIITDPRYYLPYLQDKIEKNGGKFIKKHVESFDELSEIDNFNVIVNCTGLQASKLTGDYLLIPVRGQTFKVKAPWIRHFYFADGAYILPGRDYVTLGGIKEFGSSNPNISEIDSHSIWTRCIDLVPSLEKAEVAFQWVGLRPHRQPVRVEYESFELKNGTQKHIVHNYGHGAHGITLSWGTAKEATKLVLEALTEKSLKAKL